MAKSSPGFARLRKILKDLETRGVTVGVQGESGEKPHPSNPDVTVGQVANFHEFGTSKMPARPFVRTGLKLHEERIRSAMTEAVNDLISGRLSDPTSAQIRVGRVMVDSIRDTVDSAAEWAAAPRRSTGKLLQDTGTMKRAISWAIREGGKIVRQGGEDS